MCLIGYCYRIEYLVYRECDFYYEKYFWDEDRLVLWIFRGY